MCVLMSTDSLVWWKMLTFNVLFSPLFIKHKATDLTGPLHLTPPPLSLSHSPFLSTYLSLCVFGHGNWIEEKKEERRDRRLPVEPSGPHLPLLLNTPFCVCTNIQRSLSWQLRNICSWKTQSPWEIKTHFQCFGHRLGHNVKFIYHKIHL